MIEVSARDEIQAREEALKLENTGQKVFCIVRYFVCERRVRTISAAFESRKEYREFRKKDRERIKNLPQALWSIRILYQSPD